ncbi:MAG: efflux RND transporter periplasmic adaptor subunit [Myxococcales bacterium]|nr:MAG: efflux RND transporter periplasmic adaptor subunit [Myxococcales bacterium]
MTTVETQDLTATPGLGAPAPQAPKRLTALGIAIGVSALSVLAAVSFHRKAPPETSEAAGIKVHETGISIENGAPQWKVLKLGTAAAAAERWSDPFPARFKVDEAFAAKVGSPLSGRITNVYIELGEHVKSGQPLFAVASPDVAELRASQQKAAVDLDVARAGYDRVKAMVEARALPAKDEIESNQQLRQAELSLQLAQTKLRSLKVSASGDNEFKVLAPRDGAIIEKSVLPSQHVNMDDTLVSIADLDAVWVVADLFEADAVGLSAGMKARVTSPSLPGFSAEAGVERVSSVVDPERHTVGVRVKLANADGRIRPNTFAEVRFLSAAAAGSTEIAASALVSDGPKQYVYVQDSPGHFQRRDVLAGSVRDGRISIVSGLKAGESVVEQGAVLLDNQIDLSM